MTDELNTDPWGIVLSARPPHGAPDDASTSLYLQAAGTAEAMVIEFCRPGGAEIGAVSVRSIVGHRHTVGAERDVEIVLPRSTEKSLLRMIFSPAGAQRVFLFLLPVSTSRDDL